MSTFKRLGQKKSSRNSSRQGGQAGVGVVVAVAGGSQGGLRFADGVGVAVALLVQALDLSLARLAPDLPLAHRCQMALVLRLSLLLGPTLRYKATL